MPPPHATAPYSANALTHRMSQYRYVIPRDHASPMPTHRATQPCPCLASQYRALPITGQRLTLPLPHATRHDHAMPHPHTALPCVTIARLDGTKRYRCRTSPCHTLPTPHIVQLHYAKTTQHSTIAMRYNAPLCRRFTRQYHASTTLRSTITMRCGTMLCSTEALLRFT